jgi:FkbM family methyltransferase
MLQKSGRRAYDYGLIYDVGVCNGDDSAYYLRKAARVVGIEASPIACEELKVRFADEIAEGRYTLLNLGVADRAGKLPFYVCRSNPEWSSFDPNVANRGVTVEKITVPTMSSGEIFRQYGVPDFTKIDIEGHDKVCLAGLEPNQAPAFISVEMSHGDELVAHLLRLGYTRFKFVSQRTMTAASRPLIWLAYHLPDKPRWWLRHFDVKLRGVIEDEGWRFPWGSSGAFGDRAAGRWGSAKDALRMWRFLRDIDAKMAGAEGLFDWFDIHATR